MKRAKLGPAAALAALAHEDVLDAPDSHSSARTGTDAAAPIQGLGLRRSAVFAAVRGRALSAIADAIADTDEALAARGRARRLLGRLEEARADLESAARAGEARAEEWLAESLIASDPARALALLDANRLAGRGGPAAELRRATALLALGRAAEAVAAAEAAPKELYVGFVLRVVALERLGRREAAAEAAAAAERLDPGCPYALAALGRLRAADGDLPGAIDYYHRARDLDLDVSGEFLFEKLGVRLAWQDPAASVASLDAALVRHPDSAALLAERAELLRHPQICRYEEAIRDYEAAARAEPRGWTTALVARALNKRDGGLRGGAEFDRALALAPRSGWIHAWRAAFWSRARQSRKARADFAQAERLMPWYPFTYAWRGALSRAEGKSAAASADLDVALALDPTYAFSWNERFQARADLGDFAAAGDDLERAQTMDPKYTWLSARGARAGAELEKAVKTSPRSPLLKLWRGRTRLECGNAKGAAADLAAAAAALPAHGAARAWLGRAQAALGKKSEARRNLMEAMRLEPQSWSVRRALAQLHGEGGNWDEALAQWREAVRLAPTTVSLLVEHAAAAARAGKRDEALGSVQKAAELDPLFADARTLKAELLADAGRFDEAKAEAEAALAAGGGARAHLARAKARHATGDFAGQIEDFRAALKLEPGLFAPAERRRLTRLLRGAGNEGEAP